jgi:oligopeptide transport system substrate-binding protein
LPTLTALAMLTAACRTAESPAPTPNSSSKAPQILRVALTEPGIIDPSKVSAANGMFIVKQICDPLVQFEPATGKLVPGIAASWSMDPGAKKLTIQLRAGVKFQNGRELTAQDYVYSLSRLADPKTGSTLHYLLERVAGYTELRTGKSDQLSGVKATGPQTLEIELSQPYAEFPAILANPAVGAAIPKEEVDKSSDAFAAKPVCTGPWMVATPRSGGQDIELSRFDGYYGANSGFSRGGAGYHDRVIVTVTKSDTSAYQLLNSGSVDVAPVPPGNLSDAKRISGRVETAPNGLVAYLGLPVTKAPFNNNKFRQALNLDLDRRSLVSELLGGSRLLPGGFLPPTAGATSALSRCTGTVRPGPSKAEAQKALADSQVDAADTTMNVYLNTGGGHEKWLEQVLARWKSDLNLDSSLKPSEWTKYLEFLNQPGADGPFRLAWDLRFPSPEALFDNLFISTSLDNFTRYSSQEFDGLMTKARQTVDDSERAKVYAEAGKLLCRDLPIIPIWFGANHLGFGPRIQAAGAKRVDIFGDPILRELKPRT